MKIYIDGMSCAHCQAHVKEALSELSGITNVTEVNLDGKYAAVEGTASHTAITTAIEDAGYDIIRIED